ncbi:MAG: hypothetical protein ACYTFK_01485 [Planctomycetota bacterium]|jgi:hypothetical protein
MKKSPQTQKLEDVLRSSKLVARGFLGTDTRSLSEIIDADLAEVSRLGFTIAQIAARMQTLTDLAIPCLGTTIQVEGKLEVSTYEAKGTIPCPWPHPYKAAKRVTTARCIDTDCTIRWSDLNIHLISQHNFFEGVGCAFRIDPERLTGVIF